MPSVVRSRGGPGVQHTKETGIIRVGGETLRKQCSFDGFCFGFCEEAEKKQNNAKVELPARTVDANIVVRGGGGQAPGSTAKKGENAFSSCVCIVCVCVCVCVQNAICHTHPSRVAVTPLARRDEATPTGPSFREPHSPTSDPGSLKAVAGPTRPPRTRGGGRAQRGLR